MFAEPFQRRTQAAGVLGFGGGPRVVTPTPASVVVCFAPEPQPTRASPAAAIAGTAVTAFSARVYGIKGMLHHTVRPFSSCHPGNAAGSVQPRWRSFKKIVRLWVELFGRHNLLTYASAIALRTFIAAVACTLFALPYA